MTPQESILCFFETEYSAEPKHFAKLDFLCADEWLSENAKKVGLDITNMYHQITTDFITHTLKSHGEHGSEKRRGNIAITREDFSYIADIVSEPTFVLFGVKRDGQDRIIYVKDLDDGSALYFEEILSGAKNKCLRGKSLSRQKNRITVERLKTILEANRRNDISKMIIAFGVAANSTFDHS